MSKLTDSMRRTGILVTPEDTIRFGGVRPLRAGVDVVCRQWDQVFQAKIAYLSLQYGAYYIDFMLSDGTPARTVLHHTFVSIQTPTS